MACLVQGGFGARLIPQGFAILGSVFPREHIGKAFSAFGPAHAITLSLLTVIAIGVLSCLAIPLLPSHARPAGSH